MSDIDANVRKYVETGERPETSEGVLVLHHKETMNLDPFTFYDKPHEATVAKAFSTSCDVDGR